MTHLVRSEFLTPRRKRFWGRAFDKTCSCFRLTKEIFRPMIHHVAGSINDFRLYQITLAGVVLYRWADTSDRSRTEEGVDSLSSSSSIACQHAMTRRNGVVRYSSLRALGNSHLDIVAGVATFDDAPRPTLRRRSLAYGVVAIFRAHPTGRCHLSACERSGRHVASCGSGRAASRRYKRADIYDYRRASTVVVLQYRRAAATHQMLQP